MTDFALNQFLAYETAASRTGRTPAPPIPLTGPAQAYVSVEINSSGVPTGNIYTWNPSQAVWDQIGGGGGGGGGGTVTEVSSATGDLTIVNPTTTPTLTVNSAPKWDTARTLSFTGDATGSGSVDGSASVATALTLASSGVTPGSYTSANITVDAKGRVTVANNGFAAPLISTVTSGSVQFKNNPAASAIVQPVQVTVPASSSVRMFLVTLYYSTSSSGGSEPSILIVLDSASNFIGNRLQPLLDGNYGFGFEGGMSGVISVPGDGASHVLGLGCSQLGSGSGFTVTTSAAQIVAQQIG